MPETVPIPVRFQDGEALSAAALNHLQEWLLQQLLAHTHSGADGVPIGPEGIAPGAIQSRHLGRVGLGPDQIADGAVGARQLAEHVVAGNHLAAGAVLTQALAAGAVSLEKLAGDVLAEIKKPRGATTFGWCAYLDPALIYEAPTGKRWYDWLLDPKQPLPTPKVTLLEGGKSLPLLLGSTLDATPPVKPKGPPVEPTFAGVDPGPKPDQPTFTLKPPTAPSFARPTEPAKPVDPPYQPPAAPPKPDAPEMGEPGPNGETQEIVSLLGLNLNDLKRTLDDQRISDQVIAVQFQPQVMNAMIRKGRLGDINKINSLISGLIAYRQQRRTYLDNKAQWDKYRAAQGAYQTALASYNAGYEAQKAAVRAQYDQAVTRFQEQANAWKRYDQDYAAFQAGQASYQKAVEQYQVNLKAWDERTAAYNQAQGEYRARREEYDRQKAEYDAALAKYQAEKENFVARLQPVAGFPAGELTPQRFQLQADVPQLGWQVSPMGPQTLRPALITNEAFTMDGQPVAFAPGPQLDDAARALIARIAYAFGLPEDLDPLLNARVYQFLNTPGFLLSGYHGELRNVRAIARMHEGANRFVRILFERPYPTATYTVSVTPDGRPGAPVPLPFVWRQSPGFVDICFQVDGALQDTVAFRFAIHGELSES